MERRGLRFDDARGGGVVLQMLSGAAGAGGVGFTAIATSAEAAARLHERTAAVLLEAAALPADGCWFAPISHAGA